MDNMDRVIPGVKRQFDALMRMRQSGDLSDAEFQDKLKDIGVQRRGDHFEFVGTDKTKPAKPGGALGRGVPDISANADPRTGYDIRTGEKNAKEIQPGGKGTGAPKSFALTEAQLKELDEYGNQIKAALSHAKPNTPGIPIGIEDAGQAPRSTGGTFPGAFGPGNLDGLRQYAEGGPGMLGQATGQ